MGYVNLQFFMKPYALSSREEGDKQLLLVKWDMDLIGLKIFIHKNCEDEPF